MPTLSRRANGLQESPIRKLDLLVAEQHDVTFHRLNIGQPDVPTPRPLLDAIAAFQPPVVAYGPASGLRACREAGAAYHAQWAPGLDWKDVAVTTGGSEALLFAFTAICDPGDEILVPEPYYTNYNGFATVAGATVRGVRTTIDDGFALPSDAALDAALTARTRAIVFSNPANPTGAVYPKEDVVRVVRWAQRHGIFVIADEVYRRIWFEAPPFSALEVPSSEDHVVIIDSLSKTYSACGIRLGFLVSRNGALMEKVERLGQARLGPQPLAQHVGIAALALPEAYYDDIRGVYAERVHALTRALDGLPGVEAPHAKGAFYQMIELPVDDADAFARFLVAEFRHHGRSVVVAPGGGFYAHPESGRRQVRLAAVEGPEALAQAVEILGEALRVYPGRR